MTSDYLDRELRGRLAIARDMAFANNRSWQSIGAIADGLEIMFAVTAATSRDQEPKFLFVSQHAWSLTGYWPIELKGRNPNTLQHETTDKAIAHAFMTGLIAVGQSECRLVNCRKNGELYGCHILASRSYRDSFPGLDVYFGFLEECSVADCAPRN